MNFLSHTVQVGCPPPITAGALMPNLMLAAGHPPQKKKNLILTPSLLKIYWLILKFAVWIRKLEDHNGLWIEHFTGF